MPTRGGSNDSLEEEAERLARDVARDTLAAARIGWRIANRVGRIGLQWADDTADKVLRKVERRRPKGRDGAT